MSGIPNFDWLDFGWVDLLDILVVAVVTYWMILLIKGTRAVHMLTGLAIVFSAYVGSEILPFYTLHWILNAFLSSIVLIVVVLFQEDIRRGLARMGRNPLFTGMNPKEESKLLQEIVAATVAMSERHVGALIVLERETRLDDFLEGCTVLDAKVSREILASIFYPLSPLHDGATVLHEGRVHAAGCFLPLTNRTDISKSFGTRHRAAIGITERSDAVAIVVSEEDGSISMAVDCELQHGMQPAELQESLTRLFSPRLPYAKPKRSLRRKLGRDATIEGVVRPER
ncbi:MAG: diadenylate cyclase CdaA [bacterium]